MTLRQRILALFFCVSIASAVHAQVSYTGGTYSENFDSMGAAGTTAPIGWTADTTANPGGSGSNPDPPVNTGPAVSVLLSTTSAVVANNGSTSTAGEYNWGTTGATDRALGSLASSDLQRDTYLSITNNTGGLITSFSLFYTGEQWHVGGTGTVAVNTLTLQYSLTGLSGTWVNMGTGFNFNSPVTSGNTNLDGNAAANRVTNIGGIYSPSVAIPIAATFYVRWADPDDGKGDAGLGIDDFRFAAVPEPSTWATMGLGAGLLGAIQRFLRRRG